MKIVYKENNSGGDWWLTEQNYKDLEATGWEVAWTSKGQTTSRRAWSASKDFETPKDAIVEFEKITGLDSSEEGCNCCGPPHNFSWPGGYASGSDILEYLYEDVPEGLRDACERRK